MKNTFVNVMIIGGTKKQPCINIHGLTNFRKKQISLYENTITKIRGFIYFQTVALSMEVQRLHGLDVFHLPLLFFEHYKTV